VFNKFYEKKIYYKIFKGREEKKRKNIYRFIKNTTKKKGRKKEKETQKNILKKGD
jgi:hypothetical protein